MTEYVVDANVAVKWMIPEEYTDAALRLRWTSAALASPDLVRVEVASVLREKVRRREISDNQGRTLLGAFRKAPIRLVPARLLLEGAWEIARRFDRSIYDGLYLALAVAKGCRMVTADRQLVRGLRGSPLVEHLLWVEDLPSTGGEGVRLDRSEPVAIEGVSDLLTDGAGDSLDLDSP